MSCHELGSTVSVVFPYQVVFKYIGDTSYYVTRKKCCLVLQLYSRYSTDSLLSLGFSWFFPMSCAFPPTPVNTHMHKAWGIVFLVAYAFEFKHRRLLRKSYHAKHKKNCMNLETNLIINSETKFWYHLTLAIGQQWRLCS